VISRGNTDNGLSIDFENMKQTIAELQRLNEKLTYQLDQKESEYLKAENQIHKLLLDLDKSKRMSQEMIDKSEERHRTEILNLKEIHSKDMAVLSVISVKKAASDLDSSTGSIVFTIEECMEINKKLTEQLEIMQKNQHKLLDDFSDEKKLLNIENTKKFLAAEKDSKTEILGLRSKIMTLEDTITAKGEELAKALSKLDATKNLNRQLEKTREDLTDSLNKSHNEIKNLQQSLSSNFRFESSGNMNSLTNGNGSTANGGGPGGMNLNGSSTFNLDNRRSSAGFNNSNAFGDSRISEARVDSKLKQMTNKIEFLKAQLETEQSSVEDLKNALNSSQTKLNELRYEYRLKMQEVEQNRKITIEETEKRLEEVYEERMVELTNLQSKIGFYETQLSECRHVRIANLINLHLIFVILHTI
jgi:chromosome segregation ATPase